MLGICLKHRFVAFVLIDQYTHIPCIIIHMGIVWLRALCSVWELVIGFIEVVHFFTEVVRVCKKLCTFHKRPNNLTFVFNCCGMDRSRWGLLTRLSRYTRIHRNHQRTQSRNSVAIHYLSPHVRIFFVHKNHQKARQFLGDKQWVHPRHFAVKRGDVEMAKSRSQIQRWDGGV